MQHRLGAVDEARALYVQAIALYEKAQYDLGHANTLLSLGKLQQRLGTVDEAGTLYEQAISLYEKAQNQHKDAEQNYINGVEAAIANAVKLNQFDGLQVTVLADLMQIQCIASDDCDLLTFCLPSAIRPTVNKIVTHQDVRSIEWVEMGDGLATLIFGNEDEQDKFIQVFEILSFSRRQRAYPTPDIFLGCAYPDRQLCTELLKFLHAVSATAMQHVTRISG